MKIIHPRRVALKIFLYSPQKINAKEMLTKKFPPSITLFMARPFPQVQFGQIVCLKALNYPTKYQKFFLEPIQMISMSQLMKKGINT